MISTLQGDSHGQALDDANRLAALAETGLLDSPAEASFDRFTQLVSMALKCEVSTVSLVDAKRQFFKSATGLPEPYCSLRQTPLSHSFCEHVVTSGKTLRITDSRVDPLVRGNAAVSDLRVIAYLGVPIVTDDGFVLGSLCAISSQPREWTAQDLAILESVAAAVLTEIRLRTVTTALRGNMRDLQQAEKQRDEMLHMLFHDMRTPLGAVITSLDLLAAAGGMTAEQKELSGIAHKGGEELLDMLNSMLDVNRLQSGEQALSRESIHVSALLRHVFQLSKPLADEARHHLSVVYPTEDVLLFADQTLLSRVLLNLITNAVKFCPRGSGIVLRAEKNPAGSGGGCLFSVSDNGPGVPDEEKALIFEKHQQGSARSGDPSFGLGLRFCTLAVEAHGGSISVRDVPGGGSEFSFVIPDRGATAVG